MTKLQSECVDHGYAGDKDGYGITTKRYPDGSRLVYRIHRKVMADKLGLDLSDLADKVVMHTCDNPRCINPDHLELGTHKANQSDKVSKWRQAKGEVHGRSVLKDSDVEFIRKHYRKHDREFSAPALARRFGVHSSTVYKVLYGWNWGGYDSIVEG